MNIKTAVFNAQLIYILRLWTCQCICMWWI